jgi:hypothetical protein
MTTTEPCARDLITTGGILLQGSCEVKEIVSSTPRIQGSWVPFSLGAWIYEREPVNKSHMKVKQL